eukprot:2033256-Prymnesium_polylepis.1
MLTSTTSPSPRKEDRTTFSCHSVDRQPVLTGRSRATSRGCMYAAMRSTISAGSVAWHVSSV